MSGQGRTRNSRNEAGSEFVSLCAIGWGDPLALVSDKAKVRERAVLRANTSNDGLLPRRAARNQGRGPVGDDFKVQAPEQIATAAEFTRELQALRARSGLTIRAIARAAKTPVATTGDYFSGRHLPLDRDQFARILAACGDSDPARIEQWQAALGRARRLPGRRTGTPYRGLARFEAEDARWFFGREDVTELLAYLAGAPSSLPLLLIGPSGAGKSSLLRAGLLPRLRSAAGEADLALGESDRPSTIERQSRERRADRGLRPDRDRSSLADHASREAGGRGGGRRAVGGPGRGHCGPVRGRLHALRRRGRAARADRRAMRPGADRARGARAARGLLPAGDSVPQADPGSAGTARGARSDERRAGAQGRGGACPARADRGGTGTGRGTHRRSGTRHGRRRSARAGCPADAVARVADRLGTQPRRHPDGCRLPGRRGDQGSAHPVRGTGIREPCALAAAACPPTVPPPRASGRRAAAKPRGGLPRRAAQRDGRGRGRGTGARGVHRRAHDHRRRRRCPAHP